MSEQPAQQESQQSLEDRAAEKLLGPLGDETPEVEPEQPEAEQAQAETEDQAETQSEETQASEDEEVEFEGDKFKVPRKIKDALLRQSDYTKKTQEVAEARKVVAEQEKLLQQKAQFHQQILDDVAQIRAIDQEIAKYSKLNWQEMDTDTLMRTRFALDQLKDARTNAQQVINAKAQEFESKQREHLQQLVASAQNVLKAKIPGFSEATAKELLNYAKGEGYTDTELASMYDPRQAVVMWKAAQWDKLQSSTKPDVLNRASKAAPVLKPGAQQKKADRTEFLKGKLKNASSESEKKMWGMELLGKKLGV